jgi:hypothetical protein
MHKYLTWLETADNGQGGGGAAAASAPVPAAVIAVPAGNPPVAKPVAPVAPAATPGPKPSKPTPTPPTRPGRSKKHRHRKESPIAQPVLADNIDVELVPWPAAPVPGPPQGGKLSRREWIMLGVGAGAVIFAGLVGMILALIFKG